MAADSSLAPAARRRWSLFPEGTSADATPLLAARGIRAFADGFVSVLMPAYLTLLGFGPFQVGAIVTSTLLGSGALTLLVGVTAHRWRRRPLLMGAAALMAATGLGFTVARGFWPLAVVAFVGTLNPSSGDVSVFLPLEQSVLPETVPDRGRTALFARYGLIANLVAALGSLAAGLPSLLMAHTGISLISGIRAMFLVYAAIGLLALALYRRLSPAVEVERTAGPQAALGPSKRIVYTLAGLFSIDAFGSSLTYQSLISLWLFDRFHASVAIAGTVLFWTNLLSAFSFLVAVRLARRFGLINTMVFTHFPSNLLLIAVPFMPNLPLAVLCLCVRSLLSQMDVPTRRSYTMAVVTPEERPAAAGVTSAPRSVATAGGPLLSGYLLGLSSFGWPFVVGGALKGVYDLLLLFMFSHIKPPEEA